MKPILYDEAMRPIGMLANAMDVGYALKWNNLSTAWLTLPKDDPMNDRMRMHRPVAIFDGDEKVGLFRVIASPRSDLTGADASIRYDLEHVIATLADDFLPGYHEFGGEELPITDAIHYLLNRQHVKRWQLGRCAFHTFFQYKWENETLLAALFSVATPLAAPYTWVFDTETTPWTLHLDAADDTPGAELRYRRNLEKIQREVDATQLCTRLYCLGYGEGINQLTIEKVNGGLAYLDADTQDVWGVKSMPFIDKKIEDAGLLLAAGRQVLEKVKHPRVAYRAKAIDLFRATGRRWDKFLPGKLARVTEGGVELTERIVEMKKPDVDGDPGEMEIQIDSKIEDASDSIAEIARRTGVNELYAQGATNLYCQQIADNADPDKPMTMRFYLPENLVRVNKVLLKWSFEPFRAYSTGAAAGGGATATSNAGGGVTATSDAGGAVSQTSGASSVSTVEISNAETSVSLSGTMTGYSSPGADWLIRSADGDTGSSGGTTAYSGTHYHDGSNHRHDVSVSGSTSSVSTTAASAGGHYHTAPNHRHAVDSTSYTGYAAGTTSTDGSHTHSVGSHSHTESASGYSGYAQGTTSSDGSHVHAGGSHTHALAHTHAMQEHTHSFGSHTHAFGHRHDISHTHQVTAPSHQHAVTLPTHTHQVTMPTHTHSIQYGIFTSGRASQATFEVDGNPVPAEDTQGERELNITPYLSTNDEGKIRRGSWHTVTCAPDRLTRIVLNLFAQVFVQSVGGGDY